MAKLERQTPKHETVMDVTEEQIARVYAQAFLGAATKSNDPSALVDEVGSIVDDVLQSFPKLEESLRSELVKPAEKEQLLDRIFRGRASTPVLNFLKVVSAHGRLGQLRPIARILKKLDADRRGRYDVELRVAMPIDPELESIIEGRLRKRFEGEPVMRVIVDPSLIAGIVVRVGDRVHDASIHTQLEHARRAMIDRATETIELHADRFMSSTV
jgi:F-type H+-transporting ATPase subunit delta